MAKTPQKNLKFHEAKPSEISNFSAVFEPNSKFHSPQKDVFTIIFFGKIILLCVLDSDVIVLPRQTLELGHIAQNYQKQPKK